MGFQDLLEFDDIDYRRKAATWSHGELRKREIVKFRQQVTTSWVFGAGIGAAFGTSGFSLISSAYAFRRRKIARAKLSIVEAELKKRGILLYSPTKRDWFIPIAVIVLSMGIGFGTSLVCLDVTSIGAADAFSDQAAGHVVSQATEQPGNFVQDMLHGAEGQVQQVASVPTDGLSPGIDHATDVVDVGNNTIVESFSEGYDPTATALGMHAAQAAEIQVIQAALDPAAMSFQRKPVPERSVSSSSEIPTTPPPKYAYVEDAETEEDEKVQMKVSVVSENAIQLNDTGKMKKVTRKPVVKVSTQELSAVAVSV